MFTLFSNRNFTLLFLGRMVTNAGDSLYTVAAMWLVYQLGGSTFYTGLAGFLVMLPPVFQFLTGPLVDRWSLKKILVRTQLIQGILLSVITVMAFLDILTVTILLIVMPLLSLLNQFVYPAQSAALPAILESEKLVKGNSAFAFAYQGVDLVFNALAGILISVIGAALLFMIDSITFVIAAMLFLSLRMRPSADQVEQSQTDEVSQSVAAAGDGKKQSLHKAVRDYFHELKEGIRFVLGSIMVKIFGGSIIANFTLGATMAVLPAYADVRGGAEYYGFYLAASSGGLLIGALIASLFDKYPLGKLTIVLFFCGSLFWVGSIIVPWMSLSVVLLCIAWLPIGITNVIFVAAVQRIVPQRLLARTFAVMASVSVSVLPLGSLLAGSVAAVVGAKVMFALAGLGFLYLSIYYFSIQALRRLPAARELDQTLFSLS